MAARKKGKATRRTVARPQKQVPRISRGVSLDAHALAYARLLNDPCSAPLVHPTFAGADGGLLIRAETTYTFGTTALSTAGIFVWTPGAIGVNAGNGSAIVTVDATAAGSGVSLGPISAGYQPGYAFLTANASEVRCVAACMQAFYPGTEVNRSGLVAYGNVIGGTLYNGQAINAQGANVLFENFERTPDDMVEVKWRPTNFDQTYTVPNNATSFTEISRRGSMGIVLTNGYPATGIQIRMVAVYEYTPSYALGLTSSARSRNFSANTLDQVINHLDRLGDWATRAGHAAANVAGGMAAGGFMRTIAYSGNRRRQQLTGGEL